MLVPDANLSILLRNFTQVFTYSYHVEDDVRESIMNLKTQVLSLQSLLLDFYTYDNDIEFLEQPAKEIKNIVHEIEDVIDYYILQAIVKRTRGAMSRTYAQHTSYSRELGDLIKRTQAVAAQVKQVNEDNAENGLKVQRYQAIATLNRSGKQPEAPLDEEHQVIGFEEAAENVKKLVVEGNEHLEVVSIVGMLGLGKTTLAKMVYEDPYVYSEYQIRAFVHVTQEYVKREMLLQILKSFSQSNEEVDSMDEQELQKYVYKELDGKQYLVVLDGVWEKVDWDNLRGAFPENHKRCRVLITTRNAEVAEHANNDPNFLYRLDFLPVEESRQLLRWRVFHRDGIDKGLERYEIDIATNCGGLPLAIIVIAGILVNDPQKVDWWNEVARGVKTYRARDVEQTTTMIELAYKHLPNYLKPCFLYLGVFREAYEILVWKLVRLWISEGFIAQEGEISLEDSAEEYLNELVNRNLVMVGEMRKNGKIKTCHMHETLSEFCKKEAGKENIFQEINKNKVDHFLTDNPALDQYRRLCNNNASIKEYISGTPRGMRVRSFLAFAKERASLEAKYVSSIPKAFKLMRVLEVESLIFARFPSDMCNLVLIKYLAISCTFSTIPAAMSNLRNLQTLIIRTTSPDLEIKADLWKMLEFRHLHTNSSALLPTSTIKIDKCSSSNVQTLCKVSPESCKQVLDRAPKLKKLGIFGALTELFEDNGGSSLFQHLSRLEALENLKLLNHDRNLKLNSLPKEFPGWLTKLTLMNTRLEWKEMSTVGEIGSLEVLKLKEYSFEGSLWIPVKGGFQRLTHLYIGKTDLMIWEASNDHFPKLKNLELNGCNKLEAFPHGLADIPSLQSVVLRDTNPEVVSSARRLHVLKLEHARKGKNNRFKLSIYPPGH